MKNVLKANIVSILLIIIPIDFIYSGCYCKKKPSNNGSKTNSKGKPGSNPVIPPVKSVTPPVKPKDIPTSTPPVKPVIPPVVKPSQEDINSAIIDCIKPKGGNRTEFTEQWNVENKNGAYIIKFGLFKFTVASSEVGKLTSPLTSEQVEKIEGKMEMTRSDTSIKFTFSNDGKCKLGDLVKSLNLLDIKLKINKTEHLYVKVAVEGNEHTRYINLNNGLLYDITDNDYIGRADKGNDDDGNLGYDYYSGPYYKSSGGWYRWEDDKYNESEATQANNLKDFNTAIYGKGDIDKFTLTVLTEL